MVVCPSQSRSGFQTTPPAHAANIHWAWYRRWGAEVTCLPYTFTPSKEPAICHEWKGAGAWPARACLCLAVAGAGVTELWLKSTGGKGNIKHKASLLSTFNGPNTAALYKLKLIPTSINIVHKITSPFKDGPETAAVNLATSQICWVVPSGRSQAARLRRPWA